MEIILGIIALVLVAVLLFEAREYAGYKKAANSYLEAAVQFIAGFETVKSAVNHNADLQRDLLERVNSLEKAMEIVFTLLDIHDKALGVETTKNLRRILNEPILQPKKLDE